MSSRPSRAAAFSSAPLANQPHLRQPVSRENSVPNLTSNLALEQSKQARQTSIDKLARIQANQGLYGPLYLEAGPSNRLILGLKSHLTDDIDFSLERLLLASHHDPELLLLKDFPSLPDALLSVIYKITRLSPNSGWQSSFTQNRRITTIRQATEASLTLQNIGSDQRNHANLISNRSLKVVIVDCLQQWNTDQDATRTELISCLLEILEIISPHFSLNSSPSTPSETEIEAARDTPDYAVTNQAKLFRPHDPSVRLLPALMPLYYSDDRGLVLAAYRILANLVSGEEVANANEASFTFPCPACEGNVVDRAFELLTLPDSELTLAIFEFLYGYTLIPSNADSVCGRKDVRSIFQILVAKLAIGGKREDYSTQSSQSIKQRTMRENTIFQELSRWQGRPARMATNEAAIINALPEPQRTMAWIKWTFEEFPESDISQVDIWAAYKDEFEGTPAPSLAAGDMIKLVSDSILNATPQHLPERKFVIRGIKVRDRGDLAEQLRQLWTVPHADKSPFSIRPESVSEPVIATQSEILQAALQTLVATGVNPPAGTLLRLFYDLRSTVEPTSFTIRHSRWGTTVDHTNQPSGIAFFAVLILRNLARAVRATCMAVERSHDMSGVNLLDVLAGHTTVAEDSPVIPAGANQAYKADSDLLVFEEELLSLALGNKTMTLYLSEILQAIAEIRADRTKRRQR